MNRVVLDSLQLIVAADQLRRALLVAFLGSVAAAAARAGANQLVRVRCARGEASQAVAALNAVIAFGLALARRVEPVAVLLGRLRIMLIRLARGGR